MLGVVVRLLELGARRLLHVVLYIHDDSRARTRSEREFGAATPAASVSPSAWKTSSRSRAVSV